ncbi:DUF3450 family protein [Pseudemcibacter aquimaris]|uniref:DUF3450 family protein n=1 Tax=Pseudemcibacter aquimaris TaxID=2857064 RepID=UPI0020124D61|nr:DUF3450 family protein [Pseudemcibacter aquimaris]MCC3861496.1 DUF3450 domain-containing protein [Pseudemcibacter aquimaris]WDU58265.1 DUF3450 domain-containing protein [Pseudemcibacter aquimaris]
MTLVKYVSKWFGPAMIMILSLGGNVVMADPLSDTRNILKEWVETEKAISQEQSSWAEEEQLLNDVLSSLGQEERILRETIDNAKQDTSRVDQERLELIAKREEYQGNSAIIQERLSLFERQAIQLVNRLPTILRDEMGPLINRLNLINSGQYSLSERAQNLINILSTIQDFDNSITVTREVREIPSGERIEVKLLFIGLSNAYYADEAGRTAGVGSPSNNADGTGWVWQEQAGLSGDILNAIDIYENRESPALVQLPLTLDQE